MCRTYQWTLKQLSLCTPYDYWKYSSKHSVLSLAGRVLLASRSSRSTPGEYAPVSKNRRLIWTFQMPGIEQRFLGHPARSLATVTATISRLHSLNVTIRNCK